MAEVQLNGTDQAVLTGSEQLEIKLEDWGIQNERVVNPVTEETSSNGRSKLRQPKYNETQRPIEPWLDQETRLIEMSETTSQYLLSKKNF